MLDIDQLTAESQTRLIESLERQKVIDGIPKPRISTTTPQRLSTIIAGRGSIDDHMLMMKNYICACGAKIGESMDHSTLAGSDGTAIDKYSMSCSNCGDSKEVSFEVLRKALQEMTRVDKKITKIQFPYI